MMTRQAPTSGARRSCSHRRVALACVAVSTACVVGCGRSTSPGTGDAPGGTGAAPASVVAQLGDEAITVAQVDERIAPLLLQLDFERWLLRRQATEALLLERLTANGAQRRTAQLHLEPPLPPRLELTGTDAAVRPAGPAPVTITVFCNFESPHCAAVQPLLADVAQLFPSGAVRIALRDLPLAFHALAPRAAQAARCAARQGGYWRFHDLLWSRGAPPTPEVLASVAAAAGLDVAAFSRCLDANEEAAAVRADIELARRLGIGSVPAILVNGRPLPPPAAGDLLASLVAVELDAKGEMPREAVPADLPALTGPMTLRATIVAPRPGLGSAVLAGTGGNEGFQSVREGTRASADTLVARVRPDGVVLVVNGRRTWLSLQASGATDVTREPATSASQANPASESPTTVRAPSANTVVHLDRGQVRAKITDRAALAAVLEPVEMTVDGYRLLRVGKVEPGSAYELLGLQPGDVVVAVNEQPIHEGDMPLWDALDREPEVRVRVMRRGGLAQQYTYRFD